jgi:hypothetical protein
MDARVNRPRAGRLNIIVVAATLVVGTALLSAGVAEASSPPAGASASTQLYVSASGETGGPCSKSHPCSSVSRAVAFANNVPYTNTPVTINVGKGRFVTHLYFPDKSYPEPKLTIIGSSASATTLTDNGSAAVLFALSDAPQITLQSLTILGGTGTAGPSAVHDGGNYMNFVDVTFSHNKAGTQALGGAVDDDGGLMTITDSTFVDNSVASTTFGGGAVGEVGGILNITGSLFTGNTVEKAGSGGAVYVNDGHLSILDSTITGNAATGAATGGAIGLDESAQTTVIGSTVNSNTAGGVGGLVGGTGGSKIIFGGDILVGNLGAGGSVCAGGGDENLGYNVIDQKTCSLSARTKVASKAAIGLLPLAPNGGSTRTERIKKSSAAHDVVPITAKMAGRFFCAGEDERGVPRQQGPSAKCDAGSYQFAPPVITGLSPDKGVAGTGVTIHGHGFVFLSLHFGTAAPKFKVSADIKITTVVPAVGGGEVTIKLSNPDGDATTKFQVLLSPKKD